MEYTIKDINQLPTFIGTYLKSDSKEWVRTLKTVKAEYSSPKDILEEFLGCYFCSIPKALCAKIGLNKFLFNTPKQKLDRYLNSKIAWKQVISRWRLKIDK
jgi:hypothetical protein